MRLLCTTTFLILFIELSHQFAILSRPCITDSISSFSIRTTSTKNKLLPHFSLSAHFNLKKPRKSTFQNDCRTSLKSSLQPQEIVTSIFNTSPPIPFLPSIAFNTVLFLVLLPKLKRVLTEEGIFHAGALGTMLYMTLGFQGWSTCVLYLILGSAVTKVKFKEKKEMGIEEKRDGRRGPENVWGSALTGLICAACAANSVWGSSHLFILAYVASLATKLSDTFASEIGKAYGKTTFLITTLEKVAPGTEGAVSAEGTLAALFGAFLLPLYASLVVHLIPTTATCIILPALAGFLATFAESWIGASLQNKKGFEFMTNEVVNFLNTLIGAFITIFAGLVLV